MSPYVRRGVSSEGSPAQSAACYQTEIVVAGRACFHDSGRRKESREQSGWPVHRLFRKSDVSYFPRKTPEEGRELTITAIHTADFHLDRNFSLPWPDRVEKRRKDLYDNVQRIVDFALSERPDLFLISGDIFERVRPSNEAKIFMVRKARELHDANIPLIVIGGNHDIPKFEPGPMAIENLILLSSLALICIPRKMGGGRVGPRRRPSGWQVNDGDEFLDRLSVSIHQFFAVPP